MTTQKVKMYKFYDLQNQSDFSIESMTDMKAWLANWWQENLDNEDLDEDDEEYIDIDELVDEIWDADDEEMLSRLAGLGYSYEELEENGGEVK